MEELLTQSPKNVVLPSSNKFPFWFGGSASAIATLLTHPLDLVKVRLQSTLIPVQKSMVGITTHVITTEGCLGLYAGLSAALLRQFTYSTIRFGVYEDLKLRLAHDSGTLSQSPGVLICLSALSGFIGGVAGNPADIINVRMQSDISRPLAERRNYRHVFDGITSIVKTEGPGSLFRGVGANAFRASLMNSSQLASYDMVKASCIARFGMKDDTKAHLVASFTAGIIATTVCSPVDVVKTRVMGSTSRESVWQVLQRSTMSEGPLWMFKGWVPSFLRLGPQTVLTLLILEEHKKLYMKLVT
ncbi:mitochondrial carrier domain-containing protein [Fusarium tricinctum]|uniref:Mitochondrial carrier domain-containing protein n=1 Tax=Fusarium tricinctum TaxID=61284 RepID=A0A8K0RWM0_9HYPO|nr:mitochondrial carrier domain-containing protein [Fusarium tricinctum]